MLAIVGVGVGLFFGLKSSGDSDEDQIRASANKNVAALNNADISALKGLTCESEQSTVDSLTADSLNEMTKELGAFSVEILSIDVTGETAKVAGRAKFANDPSLTETMTVLYKKESGAWKECGNL